MSQCRFPKGSQGCSLCQGGVGSEGVLLKELRKTPDPEKDTGNKSSTDLLSCLQICCLPCSTSVGAPCPPATPKCSSSPKSPPPNPAATSSTTAHKHVMWT